MADILDLRRSDLRTNVLENPYWITSAEMVAATVDAKAAGLFDFPISKVAGSLCPTFYGNSLIIIHEMVLEVNTIFASGSPALTIGTTTLDLQTTLAYTADDPNMYAESIAGSGLSAAAGLYPLHTDSAYNTDRVAMQHTSDYTITPANTAVICVTAFYSGGVATGSSYLHMLISVVPVVS